MKKPMITLITFFGLSMAYAAQDASQNVTRDKDGFKLIQVADLQKTLMQNPNSVHVFDANTDSTRQKEGNIPGAVTLTSSSQYDIKSVLPTEKKAQLVFYCAGSQCMASHTAAKRALAAGYKTQPL